MREGRIKEKMAASLRLADHIRIGRAVKDMTQAELSKAVGLTQNKLSQIECARSMPMALDFCRIIKVLDLDPRTIIDSIADLYESDV